MAISKKRGGVAISKKRGGLKAGEKGRNIFLGTKKVTNCKEKENEDSAPTTINSPTPKILGCSLKYTSHVS